MIPRLKEQYNKVPLIEKIERKNISLLQINLWYQN